MGRERVVIIGAGQAGESVAMGLRTGGYGGDIMLVGEEPYLPYQRPPLSKKYLSGEWQRERLMLRPDDFWRRMEIEVVTGKAVTAVDAGRHTVAIDGRTIGWSKLAFATGTEPRPMPDGFVGLRAVHRLRTIDDVDRLGPDFLPGKRLLVIGGGYIGLETAAVAAMAGLDVTVIERAPRILERVACSRTSDHFRALHQSKGVRIIEDGAIASVSSQDGQLTAVTLENGETLAADLAVVGVGVLPRTDLAERAGLHCDNGIVVDVHGRTSKKGIWAAGDCANFPFGGLPTRLESVQNAVDLAEIVADDMLGKTRDYKPVPWFWSDQYDTKLQIVGLNRGYDSVVAKRAERTFAHWYLRDGVVVAVDTINDGRTYMAARKLFEKGVKITAEDLARPDFDPVSVLRG
ncbi:NAD(P)/FAD-dependent oxidoreductase [Ciceribacter sp. T2.26MG-112.2]|uniref:NAD(P)/FAD-dependent oxidoreductase n=1 Tax=Ciceribacter sp. T2.26MG-112.2 TaxID=3137154 RepID=UPI000E11B130|nr:FAD-dependent oxidoreductase [Ciceribacter naphthalenivorans]SSX47441.1 unnamed protein product [Ciceribacter naphthalenivorans]